MGDIYQFQVRGHLDDHWSAWLEGLDIQRRDDGTTVLIGPVIDQAALHGVIARIRDLGLPLLAVNQVTGPPDAAHGAVRCGDEGQTQSDPGAG